MTVPGSKLPGRVQPQVAAKPAETGQSIPLRTGQTVGFRVLSPGREGELRVRISGRDFSAFAQSPPAPGSSGKAVVEASGPPLRIRITSFSLPATTQLKMPVLLGKEPFRGPIPSTALEHWNSKLAAALAPGALPSASFLREAIILSRFLASTFVTLAGGRSQPEPETRGLEHQAARLPGQDAPFWFFIPFPGEKAPLLFPGYREGGRGESEASWRLCFRLPDFGAISVRFQPGGGGWAILFEVEHERLCNLLEAGAPGLSAALRDRGFPLSAVLVRPARRGTTESEFGAMLSRETGLPLLEERA